MTDLIANASSHFLTLMLNSSELLIVIIWEEQEDSSEKVLKCCFPNCRHCKKTKRNDHLYPTISLYCLFHSNYNYFWQVPQEILQYHRILGLIITGALSSSFWQMPDCQMMLRGPLGIHSLALTYYFTQMFSFLCLTDTFHKQVKQILDGYWHQPGGGKKGLKLLKTELVSSVSHAPIPFQLFITQVIILGNIASMKWLSSLKQAAQGSCWVTIPGDI